MFLVNLFPIVLPFLFSGSQRRCTYVSWLRRVTVCLWKWFKKIFGLIHFRRKRQSPAESRYFYYICFFLSFFLFADDSYYRSFCQVGFNYCSTFFPCSLYTYQFPGLIDKIRHAISFDLVLERGKLEMRFTQGRSDDFQDNLYIFYVIWHYKIVCST